MITLIDIIILAIAYAGVNAGCSALVWLLRIASPQRASYEPTLVRGKSVRA